MIMLRTIQVFYLLSSIIVVIFCYICYSITDDDTAINTPNEDHEHYIIHWNNDPVLKSSLSAALFSSESEKHSNEESIPLEGGSLSLEQLKSALSQVHSVRSKIPATPQTILGNIKTFPELFMITDTQKKQFICTISPGETLRDESKDKLTKRSKDLSPRQLLEKLHSTCLYHVSGWWTYELCHEKYIKQHHEASKELRPEAYYLGYFNPSVTELQEKAPSYYGESLYYGQFYTDGSVCETSSKPREAEVRYFCETNKVDHIDTVKEIGNCRYIIDVRTPRLCSYFNYSNSERLSIFNIECHPLVDNVEQEPRINSLYTDYLLPSRVTIGSRLIDDEILEMHLGSSRRAKLSTSESNLPTDIMESYIEFFTKFIRRPSFKNEAFVVSEDMMDKRDSEKINEFIDAIVRKILDVALDDILEDDLKVDRVLQKDEKFENEKREIDERKWPQIYKLIRAREQLRNLRVTQEKLRRQYSQARQPHTISRPPRSRSIPSLLSIYDTIIQDMDLDTMKVSSVIKDHTSGNKESAERTADNDKSDDHPKKKKPANPQY
jgi:hypothetical protein